MSVMSLRRFTGAARLNSLILFCFSPFSEGFFLYVQVPYAKNFMAEIAVDLQESAALPVGEFRTMSHGV